MDITQLIGSIPVVLTLIVVQLIKAMDKKDTFERFYPWVAILVGLIVGYLFTQNPLDWWKGVQDGFQTAAFAALVWVFKKAIGIRLPGDPGQDTNIPPKSKS
jgi:hypothetical protein